MEVWVYKYSNIQEKKSQLELFYNYNDALEHFRKKCMQAMKRVRLKYEDSEVGPVHGVDYMCDKHYLWISDGILDKNSDVIISLKNQKIKGKCYNDYVVGFLDNNRDSTIVEVMIRKNEKNPEVVAEKMAREKLKKAPYVGLRNFSNKKVSFIKKIT